MTADRPPRPPAFPVKCEHCGGGSIAVQGEDLRCVCGSLLARYVDGHLELKCRRCKRSVTVPLTTTAVNE